jgi:hypothetical protein
VVLLVVEYKASVTSLDSVDHFLVAFASQDSVDLALVVAELVDDLQGHPRYKMNADWIDD